MTSFNGDYYGAKFEVESQSSFEKYELELVNLDDAEGVQSYCDCPSEHYPCKHAVAASLALDEYLERDNKKPKASVQDLQKVIIDLTNGKRPQAPKVIEFQEKGIHSMADITLEMPSLEEHYIQRHCSPQHWMGRRHYLNVFSVLKENDSETLDVYVKKDGRYAVTVKRLEKGRVHLSCSCEQKLRTPLCEHMMGALVWLKMQYGAHYLESLRDWSPEKNALLVRYGYTLEDDLEGKFDFKFNPKGELEIILLDKSIQPIEGVEWNNILKNTLPVKPNSPFVPVNAGKERLVYVYIFEQFSVKTLPFMRLEIAKGNLNAKSGKVTNVTRSTWGDKERPTTQTEDLEIIKTSRLLEQEFLHETLRQRGHKISANSWNLNYTSEAIDEALEITGKVLEKLFPMLVEKVVRVNKKNDSYGNTGHAVKVTETPLDLHFKLSRTGQETLLEAFVVLPTGEQISFQQLQDVGTYWLVVLPDNLLCRFRSTAAAKVARHFLELGGAIRLRSVRDDDFFNGFVIPLADQFSLEFDKGQSITQADLEWQEGRVYLKEVEDN